MQVTTTGANELIEWVENSCRFAISDISKQYNGCGGVFRDISSWAAGVMSLMTETWRGIDHISKSVASSDGRLGPHGLMPGMCPQRSIDMPLMFCDPMLGFEVVVRSKRLALLLSRGES
jgi:hypothetical protein